LSNKPHSTFCSGIRREENIVGGRGGIVGQIPWEG
jgi:hypothetical protein